MTSAFVPPRPSVNVGLAYTIKSPLPTVPSTYAPSHRRTRGKIRLPTPSSKTSLFVSLESPSSSEELIEVPLNGHSKNGTTLMSDIMEDLIEDTDTSKELAQEVFIPFDETEEHHMERARMGDDVEELTHLLAHDEKDLQQLVSPSIPISYDENGLVQADPFSSSMIMSNSIAIGANGDMAIANNDEPEYPAFIKFLFQKDENGQTLASKLFNAALLAASFGFVFVSVFNIDKGMTRGWSPAEIGMRIPLDTWASYENSLSEKPVATKTIINIVIYLLGDWLSQTFFQQKNVLDFDAARTLKNGFVGMCFGPAVHEYYEFSDWILPVDGVTIGITNRAFKILMDQTIYLSIKCSIYILAIGILNGDSVEDSSENVKNRIKPIMFAAWKFWPLVHCVTYGLVPARHRILWVNSVDLVWNAILASKARDDDPDEESNNVDGGDDVMLDATVKADEDLDIFAKFQAIFSQDDEEAESNEPAKTNVEVDDASSESDHVILGAQWEEESSDAKKLLVED